MATHSMKKTKQNISIAKPLASKRRAVAEGRIVGQNNFASKKGAVGDYMPFEFMLVQSNLKTPYVALSALPQIVCLLRKSNHTAHSFKLTFLRLTVVALL